jgi:hypothetical protein
MDTGAEDARLAEWFAVPAFAWNSAIAPTTPRFRGAEVVHRVVIVFVRRVESLPLEPFGSVVGSRWALEFDQIRSNPRFRGRCATRAQIKFFEAGAAALSFGSATGLADHRFVLCSFSTYSPIAKRII